MTLWHTWQYQWQISSDGHNISVIPYQPIWRHNENIMGVVSWGLVYKEITFFWPYDEHALLAIHNWILVVRITLIYWEESNLQLHQTLSHSIETKHTWWKNTVHIDRTIESVTRSTEFNKYHIWGDSWLLPTPGLVV